MLHWSDAEVKPVLRDCEASGGEDEGGQRPDVSSLGEPFVVDLHYNILIFFNYGQSTSQTKDGAKALLRLPRHQEGPGRMHLQGRRRKVPEADRRP